MNRSSSAIASSVLKLIFLYTALFIYVRLLSRSDWFTIRINWMYGSQATKTYELFFL